MKSLKLLFTVIAGFAILEFIVQAQRRMQGTVLMQVTGWSLGFSINPFSMLRD